MATQQNAPSKKRKKDEKDNGMEKKKVGARAYTMEDEITILQGMLDTGFTYAANELCISLQGKLSRDFSNTQLSEKIRRLKQIFLKNMEHSDSLNTHDASLFELSNKIWGLDDKAASSQFRRLMEKADHIQKKKKKKKLVDGEDSAKNKMREKVAYLVKRLELKASLAKLDCEQM